MATILGLAGSLRRESFNLKLLRAAIARCPDGATIEEGTIRGIPLYDADVEAEGVPPEVAALKDRVAACDGLLLVTPEYNNSIPGVFKNAIDWLSRPAKDAKRVFGGRPVALIGATPGGGGTILAQAAWLPVFRTLGMKPWFGGTLRVSNAAKVFGDDGALVDPAIDERLTAFVADYVASLRG
jgi:NAD(P)H-dependent FMN reductase